MSVCLCSTFPAKISMCFFLLALVIQMRYASICVSACVSLSVYAWMCVRMCVCVGSVSLYESDFLPDWQMLAMSCNPAGRSEGSSVLSANQSHSSAPPQRLTHTHTLHTRQCLHKDARQFYVQKHTDRCICRHKWRQFFIHASMDEVTATHGIP